MTRKHEGVECDYELRVTLTIAAALEISPAAIASLVLDGIFALDDQGLLFPGVIWPPAQERLVGATVGLEGCKRPANLPSTRAAYERLMGRAPPKHVPLLSDIADDIDESVIAIETISRMQHGFLAQLRGLATAARTLDGLEEADQRRAKVAVQAAQTLCTCFEADVRPIM